MSHAGNAAQAASLASTGAERTSVMNLTTTSTMNTDELVTRGFTAHEIDRLQSLRVSYDRFREYCESNQEYERLAFLKWRYQQGQFATTAT